MAAAVGIYQQVTTYLITPGNQAIGIMAAGTALYVPLVIKTYGPGLIAGEFGRNYGLLGFLIAPLFTPAAVEMMAEPTTVFGVSVVVIKGGCLIAPYAPSACSKVVSVSYYILSNIPTACSSIWSVCAPVLQQGGSQLLNLGSKGITALTSSCRKTQPA